MSAIDEAGAVLEKNTKVANMWSSGGRAYDEVSQGVSEGIRHCVMRHASCTSKKRTCFGYCDRDRIDCQPY